MKDYEVEVARDRTEYVTIKVAATSEASAEKKALVLSEAMDSLEWRAGNDTDGHYVIETNEAE